MAIIFDLACQDPSCDGTISGAWVENDDLDPFCCPLCSGPIKKIPGGHHFEWGAPRQYVHLRDEPFSGKSEMHSWAKANGMELGGADKVGGARNEDHLNLGKCIVLDQKTL